MSSRKSLYATVMMAVSGFALSTGFANATTITVAAASDFGNGPLPTIVSQFEQANPSYSVTIVAAATGTLQQTIANGNSGYDLFLAANTAAPAALLSTASSTVTGSAFDYAEGYLELLAYSSSTNISSGLPATPFGSLVIANPSTAPYGNAAAQLLTHSPWNVANPASPPAGDTITLDANITTTFNDVKNGVYPLGFVSRAAICQVVNGVQNFGSWNHYSYAPDPVTGRGHPTTYSPIIQDGIRVVNSSRGTPENTELEAFISYLNKNNPGGTVITNYCFTALYTG